MPFSVSKAVAGRGSNCTSVMLVTLSGSVTPTEWQEYQTAYKRMYAETKSFVLVFDARGVTIPDISIVQSKLQLLQQCKHMTVRQVAAVVVVTEYPLIQSLVSTLVRAGGQAAPFKITTSTAEAAAAVADYVQARAGEVVASYKVTQTHGVTFGQIDGAAIASLVLLRFVLFQRHFVRQYILKNNHK
jgi:hypothetical protein